jgi:uncharacterized protein YndB with AHSA1/START domain
MLKLIAIVVVALIAVVLALAAARPNEFRVQRSARIKAPPSKIFASLDDFHNWAAWSPWEKLDPAMQRTFSGAPRGPGSIYEWIGNRQVGQGRMEITDSSAPTRLALALHFLKPFEARNTTEFTLAPDGDSTDVTWTMRGSSPFVIKVMGVFVSMDKLVGKDFESGLANLKRVAET